MDDHVIEEIKKICDKLLTDKKLLPLEQLNQGYNIFKEKFSSERLKSLDGELLIDTIFNIGNKDGLSYWLEFKKR
ncbi:MULTISPECIES: hypothetical protein [Thermoanaerobacterium]|uniref:Uncharacterized protein n=1 Tax=Thermoanaerobacterium aotearoense SCUT27 TaxID=1421016 RepID=W9EA33_9THEO|nr:MULTISPECIES: hypothetical protein [Thermoanaerobacterium]ETO38827.1 hypothetical protein V518_1007 [Thermoanaerobacterium aotearoense SCUT27]